MGASTPPIFIYASPKCLAASLRELAGLIENSSHQILEAEVCYETAEDGEHLTIYRVVHAPGKAKD